MNKMNENERAYAFWDRRTDENVLPLRPNRVLGDGVALAISILMKNPKTTEVEEIEEEK